MYGSTRRPHPTLALLTGALAALTACSASAPDDLPLEQPRTIAEVDGLAGPVAAADLTGDGHPDLIVPATGPEDDAPSRLVTLINDGQGAFEHRDAESPLPFSGGAIWIAVGDVNEDGRTDAAVGRHGSYDVAIMLGDGEGGFAPASQPTVTVHNGAGPHMHSLALADVNDDAHQDILATCADDNAVAVRLGDGTGAFQPAPGSPFDAGRHPYEGLSVGKINDDEHADVVVPNLWGDAVSVLLGDGAGRFEHAPGSPLAVDSRPGFVAIGDLNGDGRDDVVVTHDDDAKVDILLAEPDGSLRPAPGSPVTVSQPVWTAVVADASGDGNTDVLLGGRRDSIIVLLGDGRGGIRDEHLRLAAPHAAPGRVHLADLNNDRKTDLIVTYFGEDVIDVCLGR